MDTIIEQVYNLFLCFSFGVILVLGTKEMVTGKKSKLRFDLRSLLFFMYSICTSQDSMQVQHILRLLCNTSRLFISWQWPTTPVQRKNFVTA